MANAADAVVSGEAWFEFCDRLKEAGALVLERSSPDNPLDRAEGFRHIARLLRMGLGRFEGTEVGAPDPRWPSIMPTTGKPGQVPVVKIGVDNPDNLYQTAMISGEHDYRIFGTRGTVTYLGLGTYSGSFGSGEELSREGYLDCTQLGVGDDNTLEIIVSRNPHPGNWLSCSAESTQLMIRQCFGDWDTEQPAQLAIECIGAGEAPLVPPRPPLSPDHLAAAMQGSAAQLFGILDRFSNMAQGFMERPNELNRRSDYAHEAGQEKVLAKGSHGDPNNIFYFGYWTLAPDEALVIEAMPPEPVFWNFQLNNIWLESLDYDQHRIHLNCHTAHYEPDGSVRIVVAHTDPGVPNWLTTAGHSNGTMGLRWTKSVRNEQPRTKLVKLGELNA